MKIRIDRLSMALCVATGLTAGWEVRAGALTPPPGPIASTMKDLAAVEPRIAVNATNTPGDADSLFKITAPGSYYLTGNITGVSGKRGIEIEASGVTLDLMGFELAGVPGSLDGVRVTVSVTNIAVVNGSVRNWDIHGIQVASATITRVADLQASGNTGIGIYVGTHTIVTECAANLNGSHGIFAHAGSTIANCSARQNGGGGISADHTCTLANCTAIQNGNVGIYAEAGSTITHCSASSNTAGGIYAGSGSKITDCSAFQNGGAGITAHFGNTVTNCTASGNTTDGIYANNGCTITNCSAYQNAGTGIQATSGATISNCSAYFNTLDGIRVSSDCSVRNNTADNNGILPGDGAGIHVGSSDNRIEGNNCTDNDRGIEIDSGGNFIARNICSGNTTNWDMVAGNVCLVISATTSAAILGNSGGVAPGSTDPNANFSY